MSYKTGPVTWHKTWLGWGMPPLHFLLSNEKKGKDKKERVSKQKLLKVCHQAILERLEFKNFPCRPTVVAGDTFSVLHDPSTLKFISLDV